MEVSIDLFKSAYICCDVFSLACCLYLSLHVLNAMATGKKNVFEDCIQ